MTESPTALRTSWNLQPPELVRIPGWEWEHEVRVALPPSYAPDETDAFPTLWITDNALETVAPIAESLSGRGLIPELVLVAVGAPAGLEPDEWGRRRNFDFVPSREDPARPDRMTFAGPQGESLARRIAARGGPPAIGGGAAGFLRFLVEDLRSDLSARYRMDPAQHGIVGMSGGGTFVGYALVARPGGFSRYLCGSPALNANDGQIFEIEQAHADAHDDLDAHAFFIAGEAETTEAYMADWGIVSSMARLAETLRVREYPSLRSSVRVLPGGLHGDIWPELVRQGLLATWGTPPA